MKQLRYILSLSLLLSTFFVVGISCKRNDLGTEISIPTQLVKLNAYKSNLMAGQEFVLEATFADEIKNIDKYKWKIANETIAGLTLESNFSAKIKAKSEGETKVFITSEQGDLVAVCTITVRGKLPATDVVRILTIGNSFSDDALEYVSELAKAAGHKAITANLYIGGASLDLHLTNAQNNVANYYYKKIDEEGNRTQRPNSAISTILAEEAWDYISFQQESANSGKYETFTTTLPALYNYVKARATNPKVKYLLHQTWAYQQNYVNTVFNNYYNGNQGVMYLAIVDAYNRAKNLVDVEMIVPVGTAIQNGRTSVVGDNFCRDGAHLDLLIGRYTASCTWFEAIYGESVVGNTYKPEGLNAESAEIAQKAAHAAILSPSTVTTIGK